MCSLTKNNRNLDLSRLRKLTRFLPYVISIMAILISLATILVQRSQTNTQIRLSKQEQMLGICERLVRFRSETHEVSDDRNLYILDAQRIASDISDYISSTEYMVLAYEIYKNGNYELATKYYGKAINSADKQKDFITERIVHRVNIGRFYCDIGNYEEANHFFNEALEIINHWSSPKSDYKDYLTGIVYMNWGDVESMFDVKNGEIFPHFRQAESYFKIISVVNSLRLQSLKDLSVKEAEAYIRKAKTHYEMNNFEEGKINYEMALGMLSDNERKYNLDNRLLKGNIYEAWGITERDYKKDNEQAKQCFEVAKRIYSELYIPNSQENIKEETVKRISNLVDNLKP